MLTTTYAGDRQVCRSGWSSIQTCTLDGHLKSWHIPDVILIQLILLIMNTRVLETCIELEYIYIYIYIYIYEKNCALSCLFTRNVVQFVHAVYLNVLYDSNQCFPTQHSETNVYEEKVTCSLWGTSGILVHNTDFNPLKPELNPICYLLALLGAHNFLHVSRIRVKLLTLRLLMSYIYGAPILDVSRSRTTTQHSR